jgi:hypothetical protein
MKPPLRDVVGLLARELAFRALCRHRQGERPNVLLYCARRGGSTWMLNTLAAHPGMRYVGRPFLTVGRSRWHRRLPDLAAAAGYEGSHRFSHVVAFSGADEARFEALARDIIDARIHVYPTLGFGRPFFNRVTDRVVFQMTGGTTLIEWFDERFDVDTVVLWRHPIPTSLSLLEEDWAPQCRDFLLHEGFRERVLTSALVDRAEAIMRDGPDLARHVLDWTLKMLVPFRAVTSGRHPGWLSVTYEQTVQEPDRMVDLLSERLDLPDRDAMRAQIRRPSRNVSSDAAGRTDDTSYLLRRWRERVDADEEQALLAIPAAFGIDLYEPGRDLAAPAFMH